MHGRNLLTAGISIAIASLALAPAAHGFGLQDLSATPDDIAAGANSNLDVHIGISGPDAQIRDLTIHLPPGLVGDPTGPSVCTLAQLNADSCPAESQVGTSSSSVLLLHTVPDTVAGKVYNVTPQPGEPARFGIVLDNPLGDPVILQSAARLRPGDLGLDTILEDLPNSVSGVPIDITALDLSLFGTANGQPFLRNPTSCEAAAVSFDAAAYDGATAQGTAPSFTPTDCPDLDFSPELRATVEAATQGEHPQLTTVIEQAATEAGLERAEVVLPSSLGPNNDALNNKCPLASFNAGTCPAPTEIGSARASSPVQNEELAGTAYLLDLGGPPGLGLDLQGPLALKIVGSIVFTPDFRTGNVFDGLPDVPISQFELTLDGGEGGLLTADRDLCEQPPPSLDFDFGGHNGEQATGTVNATVEGCGPTATLVVGKPGGPHPTLHLDATAASDPLRRATVRIPKPPLRFSNGTRFKQGVSASDDGGPLPASAITRRPHQVSVKSAGAGTDGLAFDAVEKAIRRTAGGVAETFKVKLVETDGDTTKLTFTP